MPIESPAVLRRLLDLFPADIIREFGLVEEGMTKAEAIEAVAANFDVQGALAFVARNFGWLHQYVYLFERPRGRVGNVQANVAFGNPFEENIENRERECFFLQDLTLNLVVDNPLERIDLHFAWPLKAVIAEDHLRLHITMMKKSVPAYVAEDRAVVRSSPNPTERDLLEQFQLQPGITGCIPLDLNRGIKALWEEDLFDAPIVKYKRPLATARDVMDEDFLVKKNDQGLYADLIDKPLFDTYFWFQQEDPCTEYFVANPTGGSLVFRRYPSSRECIDGIINRILQAN